MTYIIPNPQSKQHLQDNKSDISGTIYQSKNISLDEQGYIKLAEPTYAVMTTDDDADFDDADAMFSGEDFLFVNSANVFSGDVGVATFTDRGDDTGVPTPNVLEDGIYFNGTEVITDGASLYYRSATTTWTAVSISGAPFSTSYPTVMTVFGKKNSIALGNSNCVKFINTSWAVSGTILTLPNEYSVSSLASIGGSLFIGTKNKSGGDAKVFVVSDIQTGADSMYSVGANEIFSIKPFKGSFVGIDSLGRLLYFNGGGFDVLAVLPIYQSNIEWASATNEFSVISNRAMAVDGDLIYINLSSLTQNTKYQMLSNFLSGVWCYDDSNKSLYHRYSPSYTRIQTVSGSALTVSTANNNFTLTSGNLDTVTTGMPVMYDFVASTAIPELFGGEVYYIIKSSSTVFKLATSYANAIAGTAIDITGEGTTNQKFYIFKTNDYGWGVISQYMSLCVLNNEIIDEKFAGRLAISANLFAKQNSATDRTVLNAISPFLSNRGYYITPKLVSSGLLEDWHSLYVKHKPLTGDDKIIVKYKKIDTGGFPFSSVRFSNTANWVGTWTDTDTFTTVVDMSDVVAGDEIEIIAGVGSGHIAHISSITESSGTYTVNLGEAFPFAVSGDKCYFMVDKWIYLGELNSSSVNNTEGFGELPIDGTPSAFIQFKVELRGKSKILELQVSHKENKPIT